MKGLKLRGIVGIFGLVLCGAGILVAHVYKQNTYVRLSIGAIRLNKAKAEVRNEIALLEVEVGDLKKLSRIEGVAKSKFGLEYGNTPVLVYPTGEGAAEAKGLALGKVTWRTRGL